MNGSPEYWALRYENANIEEEKENDIVLSMRVRLKKRAIALVRSEANKRYREMQRISLPKSIAFLNLLSMNKAFWQAGTTWRNQWQLAKLLSRLN